MALTDNSPSPSTSNPPYYYVHRSIRSPALKKILIIPTPSFSPRFASPQSQTLPKRLITLKTDSIEFAIIDTDGAYIPILEHDAFSSIKDIEIFPLQHYGAYLQALDSSREPEFPDGDSATPNLEKILLVILTNVNELLVVDLHPAIWEKRDTSHVLMDTFKVLLRIDLKSLSPLAKEASAAAKICVDQHSRALAVTTLSDFFFLFSVIMDSIKSEIQLIPAGSNGVVSLDSTMWQFTFLPPIPDQPTRVRYVYTHCLNYVFHLSYQDLWPSRKSSSAAQILRKPVKIPLTVKSALPLHLLPISTPGLDILLVSQTHFYTFSIGPVPPYIKLVHRKPVKDCTAIIPTPPRSLDGKSEFHFTTTQEVYCLILSPSAEDAPGAFVLLKWGELSALTADAKGLDVASISFIATGHPTPTSSFENDMDLMVDSVQGNKWTLFAYIGECTDSHFVLLDESCNDFFTPNPSPTASLQSLPPSSVLRSPPSQRSSSQELQPLFSSFRSVGALQNWSPSSYFTVVPNPKDGDEMFLCSGIEDRANLKKVIWGTGVRVSGIADVGLGVNGIWSIPISSNQDSEKSTTSSLVFLSYPTETKTLNWSATSDNHTLALEVEGEFTEIERLPCHRQSPSIFVGGILTDTQSVVLQVWKRGLFLTDITAGVDDEMCPFVEWNLGDEAKSVVSAAISNDQNLGPRLLALAVYGGSEVWVLKLGDKHSESNDLLVSLGSFHISLVCRICLESEVSSLYLPITKLCNGHHLVVVGTYDPCVKIYDAFSGAVISESSTLGTTAGLDQGGLNTPQSFALVPRPKISTGASEASSMEKTSSYFLVGLRSGTLRVYEWCLDITPGNIDLRIALTREKRLGNSPVHLVQAYQVDTESAVLAMSNRPWIIRSFEWDGAVVEKLIHDRVEYAAPLSVAPNTTPKTYIFVNSGSLIIADIEEQCRFNMQSLPLPHTPRRVVFDETSNTVIVALTSGKSSRDNMTSSIMLYDLSHPASEPYVLERLNKGEQCLALNIWKVKEKRRYICVGTWGYVNGHVKADDSNGSSSNLSTSSTTPQKQGRVLVYNFKENDKPGAKKRYKLKRVGEYIVPDMVTSIVPFLSSYLLCSSGNQLLLLKIDAKTRTLVCGVKYTLRWTLGAISTFHGRIAVACSKESVCLLEYKKENREDGLHVKKELKFLASDRKPRYPSDVRLLDDRTIMAADKQGYVFGLRYDPLGQEDVLLPLFEIRLSESIIQLSPASLQPKICLDDYLINCGLTSLSYELGRDQVLMYGVGILGSVYTFIALTGEMFQVFKLIQAAIMEIEALKSITGYESSRQSNLVPRSHQSHQDYLQTDIVIDGEILSKFFAVNHDMQTLVSQKWIELAMRDRPLSVQVWLKKWREEEGLRFFEKKITDAEVVRRRCIFLIKSVNEVK